MEITKDITLEKIQSIFNELQSRGWKLIQDGEDPLEAFNFFDDTITWAQIKDSFYVDIEKFFHAMACVTNNRHYTHNVRQDLLDVFGPYAREWN